MEEKWEERKKMKKIKNRDKSHILVLLITTNKIYYFHSLI